MSVVKVLFYSSFANSEIRKIREIIGEVVPRSKLHVVNSFSVLSQILTQPKNKFHFSILIPLCKEELLMLYSLKNHFENMRLILVLPDRNRDTIRYGHLLYPRYLDFLDGDFFNLRIFIQWIFGDDRKDYIRDIFLTEVM